MRKANLFTILFFIFSSVSLSQQPIKKDTKIIVSPSDSANLFNRIVMALYEKGYSIETKDEQLKFIASTEKAFGSWSLKIRVMIKDSAIIFSGQYAENYTISIFGGGIGGKTEKTFQELYYYTGAFSKGNDFRKAWDILDSFAKEFGTTVKYSK